jgi:hypothetical protein
MQRARVTTALLVFSVMLLAAPPALADKVPGGGQGWYGETNDKVVSFISLGLVVGFTLFVIIASSIQGALDRRKEEKKAARKRQLAGW